MTPDPLDAQLDPRRWITLAIVCVVALIVVLDNTVVAAGIVGIGAACSLLIPKVTNPGHRVNQADDAFRTIDPLEVLDGVDAA